MTIYKAPIRDLRFVLHELLDITSLKSLPGFEDLDPETIDAVLEEGAKVAEGELFPLNRSGDEAGCTYENGVVRTPEGFKEAFATVAGGGWIGLAADPEFGGQGLPKTLRLAIDEMFAGANLAFDNYALLTAGAYNAISAHASDELKALYLPKLATGTWSGTMCLTEAHAGTDLGLIKTKAVPQADGSYTISGTKIFITGGEHDLAPNIVHLVLAKLPDAPPGTRGISLFLVPKFVPDECGEPGQRNAVRCGGIEHKMGIKGSATCTMHFDGATGWLVGAPHKGMTAMFTMMNDARLEVGIQGLGVAETARQSAAAYAADRIQGRALKGAVAPEAAADPIVVHPDVRRMLLSLRANAEGCRALVLWVATASDIAARHPDAAEREAAEDLLALMTPVIKAFLTDEGFAAANLGVQVMGGHGYISEWGMEQLVRDARITQIYEGANGIQALDLVGRKLPAHYGRHLRAFFHPALAFIEAHQNDHHLGDLVLPFAKAFARLQQATLHLAEAGLKDPNEAAAAATDYLRLMGLTATAFMWVRMAQVVQAKLASADPAAPEASEGGFYEAKLATARFFMTKVLPETSAAHARIMAGAGPLMDPTPEAFAA